MDANPLSRRHLRADPFRLLPGTDPSGTPFAGNFSKFLHPVEHGQKDPGTCGKALIPPASGRVFAVIGRLIR